MRRCLTMLLKIYTKRKSVLFIFAFVYFATKYQVSGSGPLDYLIRIQTSSLPESNALTRSKIDNANVTFARRCFVPFTYKRINLMDFVDRVLATTPLKHICKMYQKYDELISYEQGRIFLRLKICK